MNPEIPDPSEKQYIFGPVPSRRLGRSLGVDLVPFKTCSYDCIYCQLGRTTNQTLQRKEWLPLDKILRHLKEKLHLKPDYITLSGSGEPTLYSRCGELIRKIKEMTDIPVAVLTNGSMLWMPQVRESLLDADLVVPSLDAGTETAFRYVNRPHPDIAFDKMLDGLIALRREYKGKYWLEVFLVAGITTTETEIDSLKSAVERIGPDKVQINTVTRPPAETYAEPVSKKQITAIASRLSDNAEVIADFKKPGQYRNDTAQQADVVTLLKRRPCTIEDIAYGLGLHPNEIVKIVEGLLANGRIAASPGPNSYYYTSLERG